MSRRLSRVKSLSQLKEGPEGDVRERWWKRVSSRVDRKGKPIGMQRVWVGVLTNNEHSVVAWWNLKSSQHKLFARDGLWVLID